MQENCRVVHNGKTYRIINIEYRTGSQAKRSPFFWLCLADDREDHDYIVSFSQCSLPPGTQWALTNEENEAVATFDTCRDALTAAHLAYEYECRKPLDTRPANKAEAIYHETF